MLDWLNNPSEASSEIRGAVEHQRTYLEDYRDVVTRMHSSGYRHDLQHHTDGGIDDPENQAFEVISLVLPQLTSGNPRVRVKSKRMGSQKEVAQAMEMGLNRWIRDTDMRKFNDDAGTNYLLKYCVALVTRRADIRDGEYADPRDWPSCRSLDLEDYITDPVASKRQDARFQGHKVCRDKEDLIEEAQNDPYTLWDLEAVRALKSGRRDDHNEVDPGRLKWSQDRNEVQFFEVWVPEITLDAFPAQWEESLKKAKFKSPDKPSPADGFHGTIFTVTLGGDEEGVQQGYIRAPFPYWGPPSGPYAVGGEYIVPGHSTPLSTLAATKPQAAHRNAHKRAMFESMDAYKNLLLVAEHAGVEREDEDEDLVEVVAEGSHLNVYKVTNAGSLKDLVQHVEVGGISQQHLAFDQVNKENLDRATGILDAQRGNVAGSGTATEHAIAGAASATRNTRKISRYIDFTQEVLSKVAWFLYHDDTIEFLLGEEAEGQFFNELGEPVSEVMFRGGPAEGEALRFRDLELEIEPYSMERTSEGLQQARMAQMDAAIQMVATLGPQTPFIDWNEWLSLKGETLNVPAFGDLVDTDLMREFGAAMMQMEQAPPPPGKNPKPKPMFAKHTYPDSRTQPKEQTAGKTSGAMATQSLGAN